MQRPPTNDCWPVTFDALTIDAPVLSRTSLARGAEVRRPVDGDLAMSRLLAGARQQGALTVRRLADAPLAIRLAASLVAMVVMLSGSAGHLGINGASGLTAMAIIFVASGLSSIGGFAFSAICGGLLFHVLAPLAAVQLMMVCSIAIQGMSVVALRQSIEWRVLARFLLGGVFSLPVGVYLLLALDSHVYCRILGAFLVVYGCFMVLRPATTVKVERAWADCIAGLFGGITGGIAGFPGAFVTIWCGLKGWDKNRQRGVYQPFILIMQVLALLVISLVVAGAHRSTGVSAEALLYLPAALLGTWCGLGCYRRLSERQFAAIVNLLLIISGVSLVL
jgi:uncharacterized protein